jgi:MtN3 and saliva related transmembrane protein
VPGRARDMELVSFTGIAAGVCTSVASIPQIVTTIKKKKAADVSPVMFAVLLAGNALWAWYGLMRSDIPIMVTNLLSLMLDLLMLFLRFKIPGEKNQKQTLGLLGYG